MNQRVIGALCLAGVFTLVAMGGWGNHREQTRLSAWLAPARADAGETQGAPALSAKTPAIPQIKGGELSQKFLSILNTIPGGPIEPCTYLEDPYPTYNGIAIDAKNNLAIMSDPNFKSALVYALDVAAAPSATGITPRKAWLKGPATWLSFATGIAMDPVRRRFYVTENDFGDDIASFPYGANGNYSARVLAIPHGAYGIGLSQRYQQIAVAIEHNAQIAFFKLDAQNADPPLREIRGVNTKLADPHGLVWDEQHGEIVVANYGNWSRGEWDPDYNGGGRYYPPSVTVYRDDGKGDVSPLRVIQGSKTRFNWPTGVALDEIHNELFVTNEAGDQVLVFPRTANGNVAPLRVIGGPHTLLLHPMGVAYDPVRDQIWVANYGHTAEVFARTASGDARPRRVIRNAPAGTLRAGFGGPTALAYDSKRDQILVPN